MVLLPFVKEKETRHEMKLLIDKLMIEGESYGESYLLL